MNTLLSHLADLIVYGFLIILTGTTICASIDHFLEKQTDHYFRRSLFNKMSKEDIDTLKNYASTENKFQN